MPYLTPDELPEDGVCRPLLIPANSDWLAIVSGALTELSLKWNWEQQGAVTVDEAVAAMQAMIDNYYDGCSACTLPGGYPAMRVTSSGQIEQLADDGSWGAPTGDYALAPIPARTGGTADDQRCLAAANAANVLQQLYENVSDSFNADLSEADAYLALAELLLFLIDPAIALFVTAVAAFALFVFRLLYRALVLVTADLWDAAFTEQITCILYACATNTAGVVTFDWDCFQGKLEANTNVFELTEDQLKLYGQLLYLLAVIGGADALNAAGATTAITSSDCTDCDATYETCHEYNPPVVAQDVVNTNDGVSLFTTYDTGTFVGGKSLPLRSFHITWTSSGTGSLLANQMTITMYSDLYPSGAALTVAQLSTSVDIERHLGNMGKVTRIVVKSQTRWSTGGAYSVWHLLRFEYDAVPSPFGWSHGSNCTP